MVIKQVVESACRDVIVIFPPYTHSILYLNMEIKTMQNIHIFCYVLGFKSVPFCGCSDYQEKKELAIHFKV